MRRTWIAVSLAAAVMMIAALPAFARGGGSSISLVIPGQALAAGAGPASPSFGQQVTFAESTTATSTPWVNTKCWQNGQLVYDNWAGFFASYTGSQMFTLGPTQLWSGGSANCTAYLVNMGKTGKASTLASTNFTVSG